MKKRMIITMLSICVFFGIVLVGCTNRKATFSSVTTSEIFKTIPIMNGEKVEFSDVEDVGGGNFMITAKNTSLTEYYDYLAVLDDRDFKKYVDNGKDGIEGYIYTSHYMKDDLLVVVNYFSKMEKTTITVGEQQKVSQHLFYKDEYVKDNIAGAKTTFTMPELYTAGNSFIIQLKNGHFIINDGGMKDDLPYLLDYLDSLVPKGEKPIVDAWFISHAHTDHMGVMLAFYENKEYVDRVYVEEVYYTEMSEAAQKGDASSYDKADVLSFYSITVPGILKSSDGDAPELYRFRLGEKYYFNDITIDVIFTPDILPYTEWKTWNATSVVLMYNIEGQKMMLNGDIDWECQEVLLETFDDPYFDMKIYQTPHHGGNVYNEFSSHLKMDTIIYPSFEYERGKTTLLGRFVQNEFLRLRAKESLAWGDGGVVLTFPYEVGTYKKLPLTDWIYHETGPTNR